MIRSVSMSGMRSVMSPFHGGGEPATLVAQDEVMLSQAPQSSAKWWKRALLGVGVGVGSLVGMAALPAGAHAATISMQFGAQGPEVKALQSSLNERGAHLQADGVFGSATERALEHFQRSSHLRADGVAGTRTMAALMAQQHRAAAMPSETHVVKPEGRLRPDASPTEVKHALEQAAVRHAVPTNVLLATAWRENNFRTSGGGDHGVMQIHAPAHPDYSVARGQADPSYNIEYGTSLLASLYHTYHSWPLATQHYNGAGRQARHYAHTVMQYSRTHPWSGI